MFRITQVLGNVFQVGEEKRTQNNICTLSDVFGATKTAYPCLFNTYSLEMNTRLSLYFYAIVNVVVVFNFFSIPEALSPLRLYIASVRILLMKLSGNKKEVDIVCCVCIAGEGRSREEQEVIQRDMECCGQTA
jgi:hypothetical protein